MSEGILTPVLSAVKKGSRFGFSLVSAVFSLLFFAAVSLMSLLLGALGVILSLLLIINEIGLLSVSKRHTPSYKLGAVLHLLLFIYSAAVGTALYLAPDTISKYLFSVSFSGVDFGDYLSAITLSGLMPLAAVFAVKELIGWIFAVRVNRHVAKNTSFGVISIIVFYALSVLLAAAGTLLGVYFGYFTLWYPYALMFALLFFDIAFKTVNTVILQSVLRKELKCS